MGYELRQRFHIKTLVTRRLDETGATGAAKARSDRKGVDGRFAMARKIFGAVASCIAVVLALTFGELPRASAIQDQHQGSKHRHTVSRRKRAARQRVKSQKKPARLRKAISYVCPMHLDIRSNSRGTCPKCLMDLVAEGRDAKRARH